MGRSRSPILFGHWCYIKPTSTTREVLIGYGTGALWLTFVIGVAVPAAAVHVWLSTGLVAAGTYSRYRPTGAVNPLRVGFCRIADHELLTVAVCAA